jgi:hypothetical protein
VISDEMTETDQKAGRRNKSAPQLGGIIIACKRSHAVAERVSIIPTMNATKVPQEIQLVKGPLPKKSETDSTTRLYNNWIRWIEDHGYATEEQVENFIGLRQRHSSRSMRSYVTDDDTELVGSKSCIRAPWCSMHQPPRIMTDDDTEEDDEEEDLIERKERRLSKLSSSLQALGCVVGSPRGFSKGRR